MAWCLHLSWWRNQVKTFPRYWPFVRGIHRSPVNFPHIGQWRGALMFSLFCAWINGGVNNLDAGDLWRQCANYDVIVMFTPIAGKCRYIHIISSWYETLRCHSWKSSYPQTSNISHTLVGNKMVDPSDVGEESPVGAAPTISSFSTKHLALVDWAKTTARRDEKPLSFGIWCGLY